MANIDQKLEAKRASNRAWMKAYRATPEGRTATKVSQQKVYATPEGREVKREGHRRWKKSENGKTYNREWLKSKYVPSNRVLLTPEERKERQRLSNQRSIQRPGYKEKRRATAWRNHLKRTYSLTAEQYAGMAAGGCQICGKPDTQSKRLHVDHDHTTGKIRGLLCDPCNRALGLFHDSVEKLTGAIAYLKGG